MKKIGKWIALAVAGLATAVILVTVIGFFRSPEVTAKASIEIARPQAEVYDFLVNLENLPRWSSEVKSVRKVSDEPRRYVVTGNSGEMETDILSMERPRRYVSRMATPAMGFSGDWEITVEPKGAGCRVSSNAKLRIENPFFRGMAMFLNGDKAEQATLVELKRHLETEAATLGPATTQPAP